MSRLAHLFVAAAITAVCAIAACRSADKPAPAVPGLPTVDGGPEGDRDAAVEPLGPIAD